MSEKRLVWDLPLRVFHWLLVLSIAASWYTAENSGEFLEWGKGDDALLISYTEIHFWLGYWALGMMVFRLLWGIVGPKHARFVNFVAGPRKFFTYAGSFFRRDSPASVGHNPMGAAVVVLMLLMVGAQAITGLFLIDNTEIFTAPFYPSVDSSTSGKLMNFHHLNFNTLLAVISLHVVAIIFYRLYKRQRLIGAMITGRKPATIVTETDAITSSQLLKAIIVIAISAGAVYLLLQQAPPPPSFDY